jgi:hydroxylamine reductase
MYAKRARDLGAKDEKLDIFVIEALFTTVTNVNFDPETIKEIILKAESLKNNAKNLYQDACTKKGVSPEKLEGPASYIPASTIGEMVTQAESVSPEAEHKKYGINASSLRHLILLGLKGMAAYADHAYVLDKKSEEVFSFFHTALNFLGEGEKSQDDLIAMVLKCGEVNIKIMELLDDGNTSTYGHPVPTAVNVNPVAGKAILVSGHDLKDLKNLLDQTKGKGINIYTHGEMLPAHGYPELKKYPHLAGNYGGAWQDQREEFDKFPGAVLMTTNCIQKPKHSYQARIFTTGLVQWPGVTHISDGNFAPVIEAALAAEGFEDSEKEQNITVGFGRNAVLSVADKVIEAVKAGQIKHFFLIGGCDGAKPGRNYYTDFASAVPKDCVILTLACGKFRFNKTDFGNIGGIPRLLDVGQCNDAYSAIKIAAALAEAFDTDLNSLPLSFILSWYEQKAVCILLSLLFLGIKNIKIGPSMPAFISPDIYSFIKEQFNLVPVGNVEDDLKEALAG